MGRPRKIETPEIMEQLWRDYIEHCNNNTVTVTEFSSKEGRFIEGTIKKPITATIEGFCVYVGIARSKFYETYVENNSQFRDIVTRMKNESEQDVRSKFETGTIPTQLSGLWMSRYENYNQKQQIDLNATVSEADKSLLDKVSKRLEESKKEPEI